MDLIARRPGSTSRRRVQEWDDGRVRDREDALVTEEPLEIRLSSPGLPGERVSVTMRTPGHDFELAAGFLHSEGLVSADDHIDTITYCLDGTVTEDQMYNVVSVSLRTPPLRAVTGRFGATSSACGVCGKQSIDELLPPGVGDGVVVRADDLVLDRATVLAMPGALRGRQGVFSRTGGLHAAGVFDAAGRLEVVREDVGRHNAVDKVLGARLIGSAPSSADGVLCVSGRVGFDIIAKVIAGGWSVVVAVGAPSSLAVDLADAAGVTVCGFVRGRRMVTYTHPHRLSERPSR